MATQPVIVIKKVTHGKHGHHGGAWKVAYADFVTAMMAFFLVMWLVSQNPETRRSVAQYFRDPGAFSMGGAGVLPGTDQGTIGGGINGAPAQAAQSRQVLERAASQLRDALTQKFASVNDRISIVVGDDGLLIELREAPDDGFFDVGSAAAKPATVEILSVITSELKELPNKVAVEGHTDSQAFKGRDGYGNWELSADRANTARRIMELSGLAPDHIEAVHGFADTRLRTPESPLDAGNRRISIFVRREQPSPAGAEGVTDAAPPESAQPDAPAH
jgi:chemotaxis protein MotB